MNVPASGHTARVVAAVVSASTALILFLPGSAVADDPIGGVVDQTGDVIDGTVSDTTQTVDGSVDGVSDVVSDPTAPVDAVGNTVADSTTAAGDTVTNVGNTANTITGSATDLSGAAGQTSGTIVTDGSTSSDAGTSRGSTTDGGTAGDGIGADGGRHRGPTQNDRSKDDTLGIRDWVWEPEDRLESTWANLPAGARVGQIVQGDEEDPCFDNPALVCLGILYEMGRYVKLFSSVLGVLATTGFGVVGLMVIALALGTTGSAALVAARRRSAATAGG